MQIKSKAKDALYGYLFILPVVAGFIIFLVAPIASAFISSFTNASLFSKGGFVGFSNYHKLLTGDRVFSISLRNTAVYAAGMVPLNIALALLMAVLLKQKVRGISFYRTAFFTPVITSVVVWGIIWKFLLGTETGLINLVLRMIGIQGPAWLYSPSVTMGVVIVVSVLKNVGLNMVIILSALHGVPATYYEAAHIDGANGWHRLTRITVPMISPTIFMLIIITLIGSFKSFGQIYSLTGGGPMNATKVLVYYIYEQAFKYYEFGYASAAAVILFFIILMMTVVQWQMRKRWVHYEE